MDDCIELIDKLDGMLDPGNADHAPLIANALDFRAIHANGKDLFDEAIGHAERGRSMLATTTGNERLKAYLTNTLSFSLVQLGRVREAEDVARELIADLQASQMTSPRILADALGNLADALSRRNQLDQAIELQYEALQLMEQTYGIDSPLNLTKMNNPSVLLQSAGDLEKAVVMMERVMSISRANPVVRAHPSFANKLANLGTLLFMVGRDADALAYLDEAIAASGESGDSTPRYLGIALWWRAAVLFALNRDDDARADLARNRDVFSAMHPADHPRLLRNRSMNVALDLARRGSHAISASTCQEASAVDQAYARIESGGASASEIAFARFLNELCPSSLQAPTAGSPDVGAARDRLVAALDPGDFRLRHARRVLAAFE